MWYVRDVLYAVLYIRVSCFVVRGCAVSRRYINVCNCDMFSVVPLIFIITSSITSRWCLASVPHQHANNYCRLSSPSNHIYVPTDGSILPHIPSSRSVHYHLAFFLLCLYSQYVSLFLLNWYISIQHPITLSNFGFY